MTTYSIYLKNGFRADCKGKGIYQAMKSLASKESNLIPRMTDLFITYKNGVGSYDFKTTKASEKALKSILKVQK